MCKPTLAFVAAALATAGLPLYAAAQGIGEMEKPKPSAGYTAPATPPATVLDRAGISPEQLQTYARIRHDLMANPNVAPLLRQPEELRAQALDRYLDRTQAGMSAEEFVRIHRTVQNDPSLRAAVEGGAASGASRSGGASTGAPPSASPQ